jgi:hypothetical protein
MPRTPRTRRRRPFARAQTALALLAVLTVAAAMACGGDDDEETGTDPTAAETTTTPPTTAELTPEEEAKATYLEFVDVVYRLLTTDPNPDDPALQRLAVDPVLGDLMDNLATMRAENHVVERGDQTRQDVLGVSVDSGNAATIKVCSIGNDRTIDRDDGAVVDEGMSARFVDVSLVRSPDDTWQVSELATTQIFDGAVECPH